MQSQTSQLKKPATTRAQRVVLQFVPIVAAYLACLFGLVPLPQKVQDEIIPVLPLWSLVSFGAYLLFRLGYGVATLTDTVDAHRELLVQMAEAKAELATADITFSLDGVEGPAPAGKLRTQ